MECNVCGNQVEEVHQAGHEKVLTHHLDASGQVCLGSGKGFVMSEPEDTARVLLLEGSEEDNIVQNTEQEQPNMHMFDL